MADLQIQDLLKKNNEMVQKVQFWKMTAAQRESEKLELMKEMSEMRLYYAKTRSSDAAHARKLDAELQSASEEALSLLVQASSAIARMLQLYKSYMQGKQELASAIPRWSNLSNPPSTEKVNRVPPMLIGGRHIQPVVSLSRTLYSHPVNNRSPNRQNQSVPERAVPMHMLQDVFIPLTRIDAELPINNVEVDVETNMTDESEGDSDSRERSNDESLNMSDGEDFQETPRLETVSENVEPEEALTPQRSGIENPLEGPSWLLDAPSTEQVEKRLSLSLACEFTPTVRRRKRPSPPPRRNSINRRILKVMVAKMRLSDEGGGNEDVSTSKRLSHDGGSPKPQKVFERRESLPMKRQSTDAMVCQVRDLTPSKRLMQLDAPSPNGSTDSRVIVSEARTDQPEPCCSGISKPRAISRNNSRDTPTQPDHNNDSDNDLDNHNHSQFSNNNTEKHILKIKKSKLDNRNSNTTDNHNSPSTSNLEDQKQSTSVNLDNCRRNDHEQNRLNQSNNNSNYNSSNSRLMTHGNANEISRNHDNDGHNSAENSDSSNSDAVSEGRTRRPRKAIIYKERPLNRKLRR